MFNFKKKILNPAVKDLIGKIDGALKAQNATDKIEKLLGIKAETEVSFAKIIGRETNKSFLLGFLAIAGLCAAGTALLLASPAVASITLAAAVTSPLFLAGSALVATCVSARIKLGANWSRTCADQGVLKRKIDGEILSVVTARPQEAFKSPAFTNTLKTIFNPAVSDDKDYANLSKRVAAASVTARSTSFPSSAGNVTR